MLILTIIAVFVLVISSELWWRFRQPSSELSRKFIHITVGSLAAFWPWFLSWNQILFLSAAFVVVVSASRYLNLFKAIHAVERPTWGEVCFALAVGILAILTHDRYVYMASLLTMSLADGLAAVIGVHYGKSTSYKIFHHTKSVVGSIAFFVVAVLILSMYKHVAHTSIGLADITALSVVAAALENVAIVGLDNLLVPLLVCAVLTKLA